MINYAYRTMAGAYILSWLAWATSKIGEVSTEPASWQGAWLDSLIKEFSA